MIANMNNMKRYTLLYVEDEETIRTTVVNCLEHMFNVISAKDGQEGVEKFDSSIIDLVITDLNMPNKDGLTMLEEIKVISPKTPIIITSAFDEDLKRRLNEIGINKSLQKPFNIKDLIIDSMNILDIKERIF